VAEAVGSTTPAPGAFWSSRRLRRDARGAVFVEFLIVFLPVYIFFLCIIQMGLLFVVKLATEHAAMHAVRAAAVVMGDVPKNYANEKVNQMVRGGKREKAVRDAALITLAPLIFNGTIQTVTVYYPQEDDRGGAGQTGTIKFTAMQENTVHKIRVRVEVDAACKIGFANRFACPGFLSFLTVNRASNILLPTQRVKAEAVFPYQGASYAYPP
jgi:Flp pilus assembly protein TadG